MRNAITRILAATGFLGFFLLPACSAVVAPARESVSGNVSEPRSSRPPRQDAAVDVHRILAPFNPALDVARAPSGFGTGRIWKVAPDGPNKTFGSIARQLHDGDVVEIAAATYKCDQSIIWTARNITIVGVGGKAVFDATGCEISGDKGIFNPRGVNYIIANVTFIGAKGGSGNDAGIRADMGGYVYITDCYFANNQDGILFTPGNGSSTDLVIDHSEFAHNGDGTGQTHNLYISTVRSFVLRFSYSHDAVIGHEVKSRADASYILYNRIANEAEGTGSYNIDLPQGGLAYIIGNVIQKGPHADNKGPTIEYAYEGKAHPTIANPVQKLYVINNTIDNESDVPAYRSVVWLNEAPKLQQVWIKNNVIMGVPPAQVIQGDAAVKSVPVMANNVFAASKGVYDFAHRVYQPVSGSAVINAGTDPGDANGFSLVPRYEFVFPHDGRPRPTEGALDVGAYEYVPGQRITPAPTVTLKAVGNPIDYNSKAQFSWSSTNATACEAGDAWSGSKPPAGSFTTPPLTASTTFALTCTGPSGIASAAPLTVTVNDSAQAQALGVYTWKEIANSRLNDVCPNSAKYPETHGAFGCPNWALQMTTPVYVPDTQTIYFMGGSGSYGYYGNEVYGFNVKTMRPERVTDPTIPSQTTEYHPGTNESAPPYALAHCSRALHLKTGGVAMAASGVPGQASWDPVIKKIVVGPGGWQRQNDCPTYLTDQWTFDPFSRKWAEAAPPDPQFASTNPNTTWFLDPRSGIVYTAPNGRIGTFLLDYRTAPPKVALVNNVYPFSNVGPTAIDTRHERALQLASPHLIVYDLKGLSLEKYGTDGGRGTTGHAGGPGPRFLPETMKTVTGDTTLLALHQASLTYDPKLDLFVAWAGGEKLYFVRVDYRTGTASIISKQVPGAPAQGEALLYIPNLEAFVAYIGMKNDFYLLLPPGTQLR